MKIITLIWIEYSSYNGFVLELLRLNLYKPGLCKPVNIDISLFGINLSKKYLYIDIFFMKIKIFDKTPE